MENLANLDWTSVLVKIGIGGLLGLAVGFTAKKTLKLLLVVVGVLLVANIALYRLGFITIHWPVIETWWETLVDGEGLSELSSSWLSWFTGSIAVSGSFVGGFIIGLRWG